MTLTPSTPLRPRTPRRSHRRVLAIAIVLVASPVALAPAHAQTPQVSGQASSASLGDAVASPLRDANLVRSDIPDVLEATLNAPYALPGADSCQALRREIAALDAALGADYDATAPTDTVGAERQVFGAVAGVVSGIVPMRGLIRKLSGADRHDQKVRDAVRAGSTRRGYLKGLAQGRRCDERPIVVIAAPDHAPPPPVTLASQAVGS